MKYDLVVFGAGTSGCACAYIASKLGIKTLLVEKSDVSGGAITQGLVVPVMKIDDSNINIDFFTDLISFAQKYSAQHTYIDANKGWFNPELLKIVFEDMLTSVNCPVLYSCEPVSARFNNCFSFTLSHKLLSIDIESNYTADCTANGKIFKILNCDFQKKSEKRQMPSLRFIISDINIKKFAEFLLKTDSDRNVTTVEYTGSEIYLSTACTWDETRNWALYPIFKKAVKNGDLTEEEASYFQVFSVPSMPSSLAFNCPRIITEQDISDPFAYSNALIKGRKSVYAIYKFCKKYLPGFEDSVISHISDILGVRESDRILAKYTLKKDDILSAKKFNNPAFASDYPIDIHSDKNTGDKLEFIKKTYTVPIESLISKDNDKLYAAGRILGAEFEAQAAVRTQLNCFSAGEAVAKDIYKKIKKTDSTK